MIKFFINKSINLEKDIAWIPNAGHWLHAENPTMFIDIVSECLEKWTK